MKYYKMSGIKDFFLHTDTACTYQFYERIGMKRIGEVRSNIRSADVDGIEMYIYAADVDDIK